MKRRRRPTVAAREAGRGVCCTVLGRSYGRSAGAWSRRAEGVLPDDGCDGRVRSGPGVQSKQDGGVQRRARREAEAAWAAHGRGDRQLRHDVPVALRQPLQRRRALRACAGEVGVAGRQDWAPVFRGPHAGACAPQCYLQWMRLCWFHALCVLLPQTIGGILNSFVSSSPVVQSSMMFPSAKYNAWHYSSVIGAKILLSGIVRKLLCLHIILKLTVAYTQFNS